jgi:hypothetical protein
MRVAQLPIEIGGLIGVVGSLQKLVPLLPWRLLLGAVAHVSRELCQPIFKRIPLFEPSALRTHRAFPLLLGRFYVADQALAGT